MHKLKRFWPILVGAVVLVLMLGVGAAVWSYSTSETICTGGCYCADNCNITQSALIEARVASAEAKVMATSGVRVAGSGSERMDRPHRRPLLLTFIGFDGDARFGGIESFAWATVHHLDT